MENQLASRNIISNWLGADFSRLHPLIQDIHLNGARLVGNINLKFGNNFLSRYLGKKLAAKLGIPTIEGTHILNLRINHNNFALNWVRDFDNKTNMTSIFRPVGIKENGFMLEENGPFKLRLSVNVKNGGWYWKLVEIYLGKKKLPNFLFAKSFAYKYINDHNQYVLNVNFSLFGIGPILSYQGILDKDFS